MERAHFTHILTKNRGQSISEIDDLLYLIVKDSKTKRNKIVQ